MINDNKVAAIMNQKELLWLRCSLDWFITEKGHGLDNDNKEYLDELYERIDLIVNNAPPNTIGDDND